MRILAFAYACEPGKGSEPEAGWLWCRMLAHLGPVTVITRANNREAIEAALVDVRERERITFEYVDLPSWSRSWKKGQRGVRLYYILWQLAAARAARRLIRTESFDLVWHLTLANVWLGSGAALLGLPLVLGPVGGGAGIPWRLLRSLGARGILFELGRASTKALSKTLNPLSRLALRRAALILVQNAETAAWVPRRHRHKVRIEPHAVIEETLPPRATDGRRAVFAGRLIPWKGLALAIDAIADAPKWELIVCGAGPDRSRLEGLVRRKRVQERVTFRGAIPRAELQELFVDSDALLFPSLHDDSPFAVAEAVGRGLPVVCLDLGGPQVVAAQAATVIPTGDGLRETVELLARALEDRRLAPPEAVERRARELTMSERISRMRQIADDALSAGSSR